MKTNDLRKLIQSILKPICKNCYFEQADSENLYPHIVFSYDNINLDDIHRDDLIVDIDIWDKGTSAAAVEDMADKVEQAFNAKNLPQSSILPTFFRLDRKIIPDEDKKIKHRLVRIQVQNYER